MRFKKLGLAIAVVGALGAILASSAFATMETPEPAAEWYTGNPLTTTLASDTAVTLTKASHLHEGVTDENATFFVTVGANKYWLKATGVECVGCKITNGTTNPEKAMAKGKIKFTGVTVLSPSTACKGGANGVVGTVETKELTAHADWMEKGVEGTAFVKFEPTSVTGNFVTLEITGCGFETTLAVKGFVFGQAKEPTGKGAASQGITFSEAIHKTTESSLNVSNSTAILEGGATASIGGTPFGVK